jgi:choline dehydrogenase-like flavoprotein
MMGTVAIGDDPATSAADRNGLVRGTDNLHVAGNAVIPQSGHANPTLVAMALGARTATVIATGGPEPPA